jgi:hypothetical protein
MFKVFWFHSRRIERMFSLVEHHIHNYCARPYVYRFWIRWLIEYLWSHEEQRSTLSFDIFRIVDFEFRWKSKVNYFDWGKIVVILKQYVF